MVKRKNDQTRYATYQDALPGIYIDFEGLKKEAPTLIGILRQGEMEQVVLDPTLRSAAEAKGLRCSNLSDIIADLIEECEKEGKFVFAFTRHEYNEVCEYTYLGDEFLKVYKDAHKIAKRWVNKHHKHKGPDDWTLYAFADFIGRPYPKYMGLKMATKRIRYVRTMLEKRSAYDKLTATAKAKWTKLLKYNEFDCQVMQELTLQATQD